MVKHIILWQLREDIDEAEKPEILKNIKEGLEGLMGQIEGLNDIHVYISNLPTSNADVMLDCSFNSEDALNAYSTNPKHVAVKDSRIVPYTRSRTCIDFVM